MTLDVICALVSLSCALILITHCKYEDGFFGRMALLLLAVTEVVVIAEAWHDDSYVVAPTTILRHVAISLFLARHTYRFLSFYYRGKYSWLGKKSRRK